MVMAMKLFMIVLMLRQFFFHGEFDNRKQVLIITLLMATSNVLKIAANVFVIVQSLLPYALASLVEVGECPLRPLGD